MKKYNLSKIMKRAWELVKKASLSISEALKKAWKEAKEVEEDIIALLKENLETMLYGNKYIHAGIKRKVVSKLWEKGGKKRLYLSIACYSGTNYKGQYKCGYVDIVTGEYIVTRYDEVNAMTKEYIG